MSRKSRRSWRRAAAALIVVIPLVIVVGAMAARTSSKTVTISVVEHQAPRVALLKKMLPVFERTHPTIKVKLIEGPADDTQFQTKLTLQFNSGHAPDVIHQSFDAADVAASRYLLDLTPLAKSWPDWKRFYPNLRSAQRQPDGKIYTIPGEATVQQFFYRKDVLQQHGISTAQPNSWSDLLARLVQIKNAVGGPSIVMPAGKAWGGGSFWESFINLKLGTQNPLYDKAQKKWVVRSPGLTQVLGFYVDLTRNGTLDIPPLLNPEPWVPTKYQAFAQGKLAVSTGGTWSWFFDWGAKGSGPIPNLFQKVGTWNYPTPSGGTYVVGGTGGWTWDISAKTKHPNEAWELVKWLASPIFIAQNSVTIGAVSPRTDVHVKPYTNYRVLINSERQIPKARAFQAPPGVNQIVQVVDDVTESIITGKITTSNDAADAFASEAKQLLGSDKVTEIGG